MSKLTIKTPERRRWRRSGVFIGNFEHISHLILVFLLLTLNMKLPAENWSKICFVSWIKFFEYRRYIWKFQSIRELILIKSFIDTFC